METKKESQISKPKIGIYIAGPYSVGHKEQNVLTALDWAETLWERGFMPFVPHLTHYWDEYTVSHSWNDWMAYDLFWLEKCQALFRMKGESTGADMEVEFAEAHGIPVFYSIKALQEWANAK